MQQAKASACSVDHHFDNADASVEQYVMVTEPSQCQVQHPKILVRCTNPQIQHTLSAMETQPAIVWMISPQTSAIQKANHQALGNAGFTRVIGVYTMPCVSTFHIHDLILAINRVLHPRAFAFTHHVITHKSYDPYEANLLKAWKRRTPVARCRSVLALD